MDSGVTSTSLSFLFFVLIAICLIFFGSANSDSSSFFAWLDEFERPKGDGLCAASEFYEELAEGEAAKAVGYGYGVKSVINDLSKKSLSASLHLIKSSSVYGPDVPRLSLTARSRRWRLMMEERIRAFVKEKEKGGEEDVKERRSTKFARIMVATESSRARGAFYGFIVLDLSGKGPKIL